VCVRGWSSSADRAGLGDFNELRERSLLAHVIKTAPEGNAEAVMQAMDDFWDTSFGGAGSEEWKLRGAALDMAIKAKRPAQAMEVGTYCGYTAVRVGRLLPPGGKLISVEIDSLFAAIASKVVEHAGLQDVVSVQIGTVTEALAKIERKKLLSGPLGAVLLDHDTSRYTADLEILERQGLVQPDTIVLCDWSLYPGSEETMQAPITHEAFMAHLKERSGAGVRTISHKMQDKEVLTVSSWGDWTV